MKLHFYEKSMDKLNGKLTSEPELLKKGVVTVALYGGEGNNHDSPLLQSHQTMFSLFVH